MSITLALSSALTGLRATSRQAEVLSSNVANASTPGYARRSVALTALQLGGAGQGVGVAAVIRHSDLFLLNDRRLAQAGAAGAEARASFLGRLEGIIGTPDSGSSLIARVNQLESALISASANPESEAGLGTAVQAAVALAGGIAEASMAIQAERLSADKAIASAVEGLNAALAQVVKLNAAITAFSGSGRDSSSLMDERQQIIDSIAEWIPLRQMPRANGQVALISSGGAVLLDGKPASFDFSGVNVMVAEMDQAGGALSGLVMNGRAMPSDGNGSMILGGRLAAMFELRDHGAVDAQARLDGLARDLIERFSQPGLDPSLAPGAVGLFTDHGAALDPALELGLAGRISVNAAVLVDQGGTVQALRSGLGAGAAGLPGDASLLLALSGALSAQHPTSSASFSSGARNMAGLTSELLSGISARRVNAQSEQSYSTARFAALADLEAADGVDVDAEMQMLLVIERNYAANAKVIQTVGDMMNLLLGI